MTQTPLRRVLLALAPVVLLTACGSTGNVSWSKPETLFGLLQPYRVDVVQGNVVTQEVMALIQPGLGRAQVREILGTPLLADPFHADRWDYVFTIRRQGVKPQSFTLNIWFKGDVLDRVTGDDLPSETEFVASLDSRRKFGKVPPLEATEAQLKSFQDKNTPLAPEPTPPAASPDVSYPPLESTPGAAR